MVDSGQPSPGGGTGTGDFSGDSTGDVTVAMRSLGLQGLQGQMLEGWVLRLKHGETQDPDDFF